MVSFLVGLVQEFEDAMYCPIKRKEYVAAVAAAAAAAVTSNTLPTVVSPSVSSSAVAAESNSIAGASPSSSSASPPVVAVQFFEVSPTYEALLRGELQQQRVLDDMLAKVLNLFLPRLYLT